MKILKVLTILTTLTITSGCSLWKNNLVEPLCLPERPVLETVSIEDQRSMKNASQKGFSQLGRNDLALKDWVVVVEKITAAHNEQFKAQCYEPLLP